MTTPTPRLAVIIGSSRTGRFGRTVADWFTAEATTHAGFEVDVVDLVDYAALGLGAPGPDPEPAVAEALAGLTPRLEAADAYIVVTPEYNHSFPGALKSAIDWFREPWQAKPVGFVSYGGISGGLRAVEQLRLVFAELHTVTVRETVSFAGASAAFGADGAPLDVNGPRVAAKALLDQLRWWAVTLAAARREHPYVA